MSFLYSIVLSLVVTALVGFTFPVVLLGIVLGFLYFLSNVPSLSDLSLAAANQVWIFLSIFGNGYAFGGILTIGITCSFVASLFDLSNFYRYQNLWKKS